MIWHASQLHCFSRLLALRLCLPGNLPGLACRHDVVSSVRCRGRFGWHDSYTYSKALAELAAVRAAEEHGMPMLILRPTIVESAMREPAPCALETSSCLHDDYPSTARAHLTNKLYCGVILGAITLLDT